MKIRSSILQILYNVREGHATIRYADWTTGESPVFLCSVSIVDLLVALNVLITYYTVDSFPRVAENDFTFSEESDQSEVSRESARIIEEIHDRILQLQGMGLSLRTIRESLRRYQTVSRLLVDDQYRIFLTDYDNMEVILSPLQKAVYLLFLSHPEGIVLKCMSNFREELLLLYARVSPTMNPARRERQVDALCNPLSNSLNEKISRIHHAFSLLLDESLLMQYAISGKKSDTFAILLSRQLIKLNQQGLSERKTTNER